MKETVLSTNFSSGVIIYAIICTMRYEPHQRPDDPGFYWLAEPGKDPYLVEVCIEADSHNMFYVLVPGDDRHFAPDFWCDALWFGPLDEIDLQVYLPR